MVHWKWESQVIGLLESPAIPLTHFLPINKDILYASDCIGGCWYCINMYCINLWFLLFILKKWSDTVCLKFWDFWVWQYFRGIEEWHVWKAHLNYWRFLLSTWYHQQSHKALILKIYELLESPAEYTDSWNISTAAVMIRGTVVRRRSPLLPWIWERHLKQHRCRRWVTRAFWLFLKPHVFIRDKYANPWIWFRSAGKPFENLLKTKISPKPKLFLAKLKCHFPALRVQLAQKSNRGCWVPRGFRRRRLIRSA